MVQPKPLLLALSLFILAIPIPALKIATSLLWIEHTPQPYAIQHFYPNTSTSQKPILSSGGVADLASNPQTYSLAANAETQGLKQFSTHRNLRLIYIICEVAYRLVANKNRGITKLSDLRGKKIGTIKGSSAEVFIHTLLSAAGIKDTEYTLVNGKVCMKAPCASDTFPAQIASGVIDAFGVWEPAVELGIQALGHQNAAVFQNASIYREIYALYSTTDALSNPSKRKDIVDFVRALNKTLDVFSQSDDKLSDVYAYVAKEVGMDTSVVRDVWADHKWPGRWDNDELLGFLVQEDTYLAVKDNRARISRKDLQMFLDTSVLEEL